MNSLGVMRGIGATAVAVLLLASSAHAEQNGLSTPPPSLPVRSGTGAITGSVVFREGLVFHLPGITIQVAQECSGVRSSLVLFLTSLLAGHLFFKSPWRQAALTCFVIPLAILRNGFRIFTIGELCVHISPAMIDSPIHHRGGPVFFALSLIPFFLLLLWLRRGERRLSHAASPLSGLLCFPISAYCLPLVGLV